MRRDTKATGAGANNPDTGGATGTSKRATRSTTKTANTNTINEATAVNANVEDHPMYRRTTVKVLQQKLTLENVQFTTKDKKPTLFTLVRDNGLLDEDVDKENATPVVNAAVVASSGVTELPNERHPHSSNSSSTASDSSDANTRDSNHSNSSGDSSSAVSSSSGELPYSAQLFITRNHLRAEKRENTMLHAKDEMESNRQLLDCNRKFLGSFDKDGNWEMGKVEKRLRECGAKATNEHSRSRLRDELFKVRDLVMNHRVALKRESWTQSSRFSPTIQVSVLQTIMRK